MSKETEEDILKGFLPEEVQTLTDNRENIEKALKIRSSITAALIAIVTADLIIVICYIMTFVTMDDHAWFDWVDIMHVILILVLLLCLAQTMSIYRNLKYLLVVSLILFSVDIVISSFLRPLTIQDANPLNVHKVDLKRLLLMLQVMLTLIDAVCVGIALYFRYGSALQYDEVYTRYLDIDIARQRYMKIAIMYNLSNEGHEINARNMQKQIEMHSEDERRRQTMSEMQRIYAENYQSAVSRRAPAPPPTSAEPVKEEKPPAASPPITVVPAVEIRPQPPTAAKIGHKRGKDGRLVEREHTFKHDPVGAPIWN